MRPSLEKMEPHDCRSREIEKYVNTVRMQQFAFTAKTSVNAYLRLLYIINLKKPHGHGKAAAPSSALGIVRRRDSTALSTHASSAHGRPIGPWLSFVGTSSWHVQTYLKQSATLRLSGCINARPISQ